MLNSFWNGTLISLPVVAGILLGRIISKIANKIITISTRINIGKCDSTIKIVAPFSYRYPKMIELGKKVVISKGTVVSSELENNRKLIFEDNVAIGINCRIDFTGGVTMRKNSHLAHNVVILTHDHGYDHTAEPKPKGLEIGENVFVGMNTIITHNVSRIGNNAVIGVGSVVTKDVPDNAIVAGVPAKLIKFRNNE